MSVMLSRKTVSPSQRKQLIDKAVFAKPKTGLGWRAFVLAIFCWHLILTPHVFAQDFDPERPRLEAEDPLANMTREEWQERVRQARRQAQDAAAKARSEHSYDAGPSPEDVARRASERVLNDSTLERGDIVVTDKGTFVFRGSPDDGRKPGDFEPRTGLSRPR